MAERTRVFTGTTPDGQQVLVTMFEEADGGVFSRPQIVGMEVAFRDDSHATWSPPTPVTEET